MQDWLGFGVAEIGGTPPRYDDWKPRSQGYDDNGLRNLPPDVKEDFEMLVRLWGDWGGYPEGFYIIGSLDDKDWSVGGRQDHW